MFRYGRKRTIQLPVVFLLIFLVVAGVSPNVHVYNVSQFIVGAALGGYRMNSIVLGTSCMLFLTFFVEVGGLIQKYR